MPREAFQDELEALQADVVGMGEHVLAQLDDALTALETGDEALAREVIDGDAAVNERYLDLEARCVDLFALQQPVASDLRFVAAAFKILTDLERVGDLATNLGQYALAAEDTIGVSGAARERGATAGATDEPTAGATDEPATGATDEPTAGAAGGSPSLDIPPERVTEIGRDAQTQLADAMTAFAAEDGDACTEIAERDDEIDVLCQHAGEDVVRGLVAAGADEATEWDLERSLDDVSRVLLTIRDIERVGDHAVNVAARTLYMVDHDPTLIV